MRHTVALLLCLISSAASAGGEAEAVVEKWYAALTAADSAAFKNLIADDAVITLNDLETDQSKQDFLDSLGEWEDAMKGATIRRRIETSTADTATVLVCYTFPNNESLGRESFRVEGGRVKESVQITLGDSCAAF